MRDRLIELIDAAKEGYVKHGRETPRKYLADYIADNEAVQKCNHRVQSFYDGFCNSGYLKCGFYCNVKDDWCDKCKTKPITRPFQSWGYVYERSEING